SPPRRSSDLPVGVAAIGRYARGCVPYPPSQSALPPTALPKGEPRVSYTNSVGVLASPSGRGVTPWRDGEGMTERAVILTTLLYTPLTPPVSRGAA
ncbi:MAG: hypothetical protein FWH14_05630, partial [Oscillospiraceae bacterium]|nr:hypothetical protein [Oscillospiraceae bacterium]